MKDLWVHYSSDLDSDLDRQIRAIVEVSGGKWFGSGMNLVDDSEGRDNSFKFNSQSDLKSAVSDLSLSFSVELMRETGGAVHYRVK